LLIDCIGWIIFGLIAGAIAGIFVPGRNPGGCIGTIAVGILGSILGGWVVRNLFGAELPFSFIGSLLVAVLGAVIILFVLRAFGVGART
jgi:uncharacterized membrane protein YeaQ/YmgE (transglycosylase-associated protein family)